GVDLSRLIRLDLRAGVVWLIRLGCARIDGYLRCCRWVIGHAEQLSRSQSGESRAPSSARACRWTRAQLVAYGLVVSFGSRTRKRSVWRGLCSSTVASRLRCGRWSRLADAVRVTPVGSWRLGNSNDLAGRSTATWVGGRHRRRGAQVHERDL